MKTIIVAGCTRSGLSLMMQMLHKGGYPCVGEYPAFEEYNIGEIDFKEATGKAVKVVDTLHQFPPAGDYFVIRLRRDLKQQAKSMVKLLQFIGIPIGKEEVPTIIDGLKKDYQVIDSWTRTQTGMVVIDFEAMITNPEAALEKISRAIGYELDIEAADCVVSRDPKCYDGMLELKLI